MPAAILRKTQIKHLHFGNSHVTDHLVDYKEIVTETELILTNE